MAYIFNKKEYKQRRATLRNRITKAEFLLWSQLKNKQLKGYKFRRQHGINNYIVDFYCPTLRLVIEVDGDTHYYAGAQSYDEKRQTEIESLGIKFIRVSNHDVLDNLEGVVETLMALLPDQK